MKDRMALAMVDAAEAGRPAAARRRGGRVHRRQHRRLAGLRLRRQAAIRCRSSPRRRFAREKLDHMAAAGAPDLIPSDGRDGRRQADVRRWSRRRGSDRSATPAAYWTDQLNERRPADRYRALAEEIWAQTGGEVGAFVQTVGTARFAARHGGGSARTALVGAKIVAVELAESAGAVGRRERLAQDRRGGRRFRGAAVGRRPRRRDRDRVERRSGRRRGASRARKGSSRELRPAATWRARCGWPQTLGAGAHDGHHRRRRPG